MSIDRRLRNGLQDEASGIDPDTHDALALVQTRAVRETRRTRVFQAAAAVAVAVLVAILLPLGLDRLGGEDRRITPAAPLGLEGTYVVDVVASAETRRAGVAGRWVVTFAPNGLVDLAAPEGVSGISGGSYSVEGEVMRTSSLVDQPGCQASGRALGTYRWSRVDDGVRFAVVSDDCQARVLLFAYQDWERVP
ncbi:MAG: hypothetical protein ACXWDL_08000 [Nocardioides sp.]